VWNTSNAPGEHWHCSGPVKDTLAVALLKGAHGEFAVTSPPIAKVLMMMSFYLFFQKQQ